MRAAARNPVISIAKANDLFRSTLLSSPVHKTVLTQGVASHPRREEIITQVRAFDIFTQDNDPNQEHDFGAFEIGGEKFFWNIDYYDPTYSFGARPQEGPVARLLTIMMANEY